MRLEKRSLLQDFIIVVSLLILTLTVFFVYRIHSVESKILEQNLQNVSEQISNHFAESVDYTENVLNYMGYQMKQYNNPLDYKYTLDLFNSFAQNPKITRTLSWTLVSWVDRQNKLKVDARLGILGKEDIKDVAKQPHIEKAREQMWQTQLAAPRKGNTSGKWIIPAALGISDIDGHYIGSFIYGFDIEKLQKRFQEFTLGKNIDFALVGASHQIILSSKKDFIIKENFLEGFDISGSISQHFAEINLFSGAGTFVYKFDKYPYAIYLQYGDGALFTALTNALRENTLEIILAIIILAILTYYFSNRIVLPIKQLSDAAIMLSSNHNNTRIVAPASKELFSLARALTILKVYKRRDKKAKEAVDIAYTTLEQETIKLNQSTEALKISHAELKQANLRIQELIDIHNASDKEKEAFLRDMYHALNTPLNAVINGADIMRKEILGGDIANYREYLEAMYDAGMQLKCFTTEFIYPEELDIRSVLEKCVTIQKKYAIANEIDLVSNISDYIPPLYADKLRLRQVILSALYHSMYYVPKGGKTKISTHVGCNANGIPDYLTISIQDNGWGYSEQQREKFWQDKFGKEIDSYSRNPDMMKLSLSTLKHFMGLHQGSLMMQSTVGVGSVFTIILPFCNTNESYIEELPHHGDKKPIDNITQVTNIINFPKKKNE